MKKYFPLHVHSHYSLLDGLSQPKKIAKRVFDMGVEGCAITDHGSVCGHIQFLEKINNMCTCGVQKSDHPTATCESFSSAQLKPLLGCELYISNQDASIKTNDNRKLAHLCVIAKNDSGWKDLLKIVSTSNNPDFFYHKPRVDLNTFFTLTSNQNIMAFSGHIGSHMSNVLFDNDGNLQPNWKNDGIKLANILRDGIGKENFFLEVQLMDHKAFPKQKLIADCIREISKATGIPCVATPDAHYAYHEDAIDQHILLCSNMRVTIQQASRPEFGLSGFFRSKQYHIPSVEEMNEWHTEEELDNTLLFASRVSRYENILKDPILPKFPCPNDLTPAQYLRQLCIDGWNKKIKDKIPKNQHQEYGDRIKHELEVLQGAKLDSYFLIVSDILRFVRSNKWLAGPGRGSAAGSLVAYLTNITSIDPIKYHLLFERFYNAGRNTAERISMPDIDIDVPIYSREKIISYIRDKYGHNNVGQMATFQTMKGRGAIKDVLRAYGGMSYEEMNEITKNIIQEHKITDELQKMKESTGESSIIRWCLENTPKKLEKWCELNDKGELIGPLAARFEQAIRLEGTKTNISKHAAGIVIASESLDNICPMILDSETKTQFSGFEMNDLEAVGGLKLDILGLAALDKGMGVSQNLAYGTIKEI